MRAMLLVTAAFAASLLAGCQDSASPPEPDLETAFFKNSKGKGKGPPWLREPVDTTPEPSDTTPPPSDTTSTDTTEPHDTLAIGTKEDTLSWAGYTWRVPNARSSPGPTNFNSKNVWVDGDGHLHLRLSKINGTWYGAYLHMLTHQRLGFGTYEWKIRSTGLNTLDANIVFGLFNYPTSDVGGDGTNEIDIEAAKWGNPDNPNLWYVVYPEVSGSNKYLARRVEYPTEFTHRFTWTGTRVEFETVKPDGTAIASGTIEEDAGGDAIPQDALPVHMNMWLYKGQAPTNGVNVEVVITSFRHSPL